MHLTERSQPAIETREGLARVDFHPSLWYNHTKVRDNHHLDREACVSKEELPFRSVGASTRNIQVGIDMRLYSVSTESQAGSLSEAARVNLDVKVHTREYMPWCFLLFLTSFIR